jgi:sulfur relay (sulfurtransferase) DsrF/TusC family protein
MAGLVFKQPRHGWIKRQLKIKQRSPLQACLASDKKWHIYPMSCRKVLMISWKKQKPLHIDQVDLQSFHEGLPQYDEDGFMAELQALPDQDELEESKVPGTW